VGWGGILGLENGWEEIDIIQRRFYNLQRMVLPDWRLKQVVGQSIVFGCEILAKNLEVNKEELVRGCYE
jgi:hypothetical protein